MVHKIAEIYSWSSKILSKEIDVPWCCHVVFTTFIITYVDNFRKDMMKRSHSQEEYFYKTKKECKQ